MDQDSQWKDRLEQTARRIFGDRDREARQRWVQYWMGSRQRNERILKDFAQALLVDFRGKRILDVGCGTGGLGEIAAPLCRRYVGGDYHRHVLDLALLGPRRHYVQCSGVDLPFPPQSFDYIFAFDVIEHLQGGLPSQLRFLQELGRTLDPLGMIFLTTPNFWYPREGHTGMWGPQFLPRGLQDRYIAWRNPGFLREHESFSRIHLLSPARLKRLLAESRLTFLHDLPCCLDRPQYFQLHPRRRWLGFLALDWYPHGEFWGVLVHPENRERLRLKLKKNWYYELHQPSPEPPGDFGPRIDFEDGFFGAQLGPGWFWHERDRRGFRWMGGEATAYLQTSSPVHVLEIEGYSPWANQVTVEMEGILLGSFQVEEQSFFYQGFLLPFDHTDGKIFQLTLRADRVRQPEGGQDPRRLSVMIFRLELRA